MCSALSPHLSNPQDGRSAYPGRILALETCGYQKQIGMELSTFEAPNGVAVSADDVVALLTGPNSQQLAVRHVSALKTLCSKHKDGFFIRDLPRISTLLDFTASAVKQGQATFEAPLGLLLKCAATS